MRIDINYGILEFQQRNSIFYFYFNKYLDFFCLFKGFILLGGSIKQQSPSISFK